MNLSKGKLARRLYDVLAILMAFCMMFIGCGRYPIEEKGFELGFRIKTWVPIKLGVKSVTDTFNTVDVSFDLYYGFYNKDEINNDNEKLFSYQQLDEKIIFVI